MSVIKNNLKVTNQGDGAIVLDKTNGIYFQVNQTGLTILTELLRGGTTSDIIIVLKKIYNLSQEEAETDIYFFIESLKELRII